MFGNNSHKIILENSFQKILLKMRFQKQFSNVSIEQYSIWKFRIFFNEFFVFPNIFNDSPSLSDCNELLWCFFFSCNFEHFNGHIMLPSSCRIRGNGCSLFLMHFLYQFLSLFYVYRIFLS